MPATDDAVEVTKEMFVEVLNQAIEQHGTIQAVARQLDRPERYIYRWLKGQGPDKSVLAQEYERAKAIIGE